MSSGEKLAAAHSGKTIVKHEFRCNSQVPSLFDHQAHPELVQLPLLSEDLIVSPGQLPLQGADLRLLARDQTG